MNIMADDQATRQRNTMTAAREEVIPLSRAQIRINKIAVTRDSQRWLLHAASKIPIKEYYQDKWGWNDTTFELIAWETQAKLLIKNIWQIMLQLWQT
jgi:hypothetical protein